MRRPKTNRSFILLDKDVTVGVSVTVFVLLAAVAQKKEKATSPLQRLPRSNVTKDLVRRSLNCSVKVSNDSRLKISYPCPKGSNLRPCRAICCMAKSDEAWAKAESPPARPRIPPRGDMPSAVDEFSDHSKGTNLGKTKRQIRHRLSFIFYCVRDLFQICGAKTTLLRQCDTELRKLHRYDKTRRNH